MCYWMKAGRWRTRAEKGLTTISTTVQRYNGTHGIRLGLSVFRINGFSTEITPHNIRGPTFLSAPNDAYLLTSPPFNYSHSYQSGDHPDDGSSRLLQDYGSLSKKTAIFDVWSEQWRREICEIMIMSRTLVPRRLEVLLLWNSPG